MTFWRRKKVAEDSPPKTIITFGEAKEATRRAAFLNVGARVTDDEERKAGLAELFRVCREAAISAGAVEGLSQTEIDDEIGALCDADVDRLKAGSDKEFVAFAQESGVIVNRFLEKLF
ncbi:hypothetical protein OF829_16265 [Sphingomonas sp. LB-2]|uniref:hypothetical protein n=1 Tax=Sphingomonas caeni TaxID=2984949 RepID=UPI0022310885|nr:hypothetical protein [Sphingomonas caeni]MCW3848793.1 hypothetical protein [Sphingomonas caeni]